MSKFEQACVNARKAEMRGDFNAAIDFYNAAIHCATGEHEINALEQVLDELAVARFGLSLPANVSVDFEKLIAHGDKLLKSDAILARYCYLLAANFQWQVEDQEFARGSTLQIRFAKAAARLGEINQTLGFTRSFLAQSGPYTKPEDLEAAHALLDAVKRRN